MVNLSWLFLSELLVIVMIWVFIVTFNEGFGRDRDIEDLVHHSFLSKGRAADGAATPATTKPRYEPDLS